MKANRLAKSLLLLVAIAGQLPAQQTEADRKLLAEIRAKAEKGDTESQFDLGAVFYFGDLGVAKEEAVAVTWFRKAAEQNLAQAQFNLGDCYYNGKGVAKDFVAAVLWLGKAAEQGYGMAQVNLGTCYGLGNGVSKDQVEAGKWYRKAAEQGLAMAQTAIG